LDGHSGTSALKKYFNYNNSDFDNFLKERGFFIPELSFSNYLDTRLSITSILNMNYIDLDSKSEKELEIILKQITVNNLVTRTFEKNGYEIIYFYNEHNIVPHINSKNELCNNSIGNHRFLTFVLNNTPIVILGNIIDPSNYKQYAENRLCIFNEISSLDEKFSQPMFVHAHILMPHFPYLFDSEGNVIADRNMPEDQYPSAYLAQLQYTDLRIQQILEKLLANDPKPIIIIQSDHGFRGIFDENDENTIRLSFSNFAAYYFPNKVLEEDDFSVVTPVNSFRILFNKYFGTNYEILENKMYLKEGSEFRDITNILKPQ